MKKYFLYALYVIIGGGLLYGLVQIILVGYSASWTGFGEYTSAPSDIVQSKKLWDWMELLIIPLVLAIGAFYLNRSERAVERETANKRAELEREIALDRQQEVALQSYIDRMAELLLKEKLRTTEVEEVRDIARTRTVTVMRGLDPKRNNLVIQFLREAKLVIDENSILRGANMESVNLVDANLEGAYLVDANLEGANLRNANLVRANLARARNITEEQLAKVKSLKGAIMPDGTKHE